MIRCIRRAWRKHHGSISTYSAIAIFSSAVTSLMLLVYVYFPIAIANVTGVPREIVDNAVENDVASVLLFGDYEKRHNFVKGVPTEFGAMPFDVEERLMGPPYYWTYEEVHRKGFVTGFSDLP